MEIYRKDSITRVSEFLSNVQTLNYLIQSTAESIESMTYPNSLGGSGSHSNDNKETDKQIKRAELQERLTGYMESLFDYKEALVRLITESSLKPKLKTLLEQKYILNKPHKLIADTLNYTVDYIKRLDGDLRAALVEIPTYWNYLPKI